MRLTKKHILLLLLFPLWACKPMVGKVAVVDEIDRSELNLSATEGLFYHEDAPFTGVALSYAPDGTLLASESFSQGKRHGVVKKWYESGIQSYEVLYNEGKLHGKGYSWWPNGQLRSAMHYTAGIAHGKQKQWFRSGSLFKEINLIQGKEMGMQKAWRENGTIYNNYEAKNGRIFGLKRSKLCFELKEEEVQYGD